MPSDSTFELETIPARIADLEFQMKVPQGWAASELPPASDDFSDPTLFLPLLLRIAPVSPVILAVAARPAYENGTIHDWVPYLIQQQQCVPVAMGAGEIGSLKAIIGSAAQPESDIGPRHLQFAFFEDGQRLVNIFLSSPQAVEREVEDVWQAALRSFQLARPRGQTAHPDLAEMVAKAAANAPAAPVAEGPSNEDAVTGATANSVTTEQVVDRANDAGFIHDKSKPDWWNRAMRLEWDGKVEEAEQVIKDGVPHAYFALATADMHRTRMARLLERGDAAGAKVARDAAENWAFFFASQATSGGEGTAFSNERDAFLATLPKL